MSKPLKTRTESLILDSEGNVCLCWTLVVSHSAFWSRSRVIQEPLPDSSCILLRRTLCCTQTQTPLRTRGTWDGTRLFWNWIKFQIGFGIICSAQSLFSHKHLKSYSLNNLRKFQIVVEKLSTTCWEPGCRCATSQCWHTPCSSSPAPRRSSSSSSPSSASPGSSSRRSGPGGRRCHRTSPARTCSGIGGCEGISEYKIIVRHCRPFILTGLEVVYIGVILKY